MDVVIKSAERSDINGISILFDAYRVFYGKPSNIELAAKFIEARIQNQDSEIVYAMTDDTNYIGFIQLYPIFSSVSANKVWVLNDLFILKAFREKNVARNMISEVHSLASESGIKEVRLCTEVDNSVARKIYESMGYKPVNNFRFYSKSL